MERGADGPHIRRQYKRLAKRFHPDINQDPDAASQMKALNEAYAVLGDPERRTLYDRLNGGSDWWDDSPYEEATRAGARDEQALRRFEGDLDNELSVAEALVRRRAARDLLVRKTGYREYQATSTDHTQWHRVSMDTGCRCPDSHGDAGPFGCKHWYAVEAFRNNGDKPVAAPASTH